MARGRRCKIVHASTSEVYGDPSVHPQPESYVGHVNPIGERACYDEGKRAAETLFTDAKRMWNVDARLIRIFNTYGPRMACSDGRVVSNFIVQALQGQPLTLYGSGQQSRSFCYVSDLIDGILALSRLDCCDGPVNLGYPQQHTMAELADKVLTLTGSSSEIVRRPLPPDDPKQRQPDITRAHALIGFSPKVSLEEGLQHTIADFRARLNS
jgi:UDP-glucuronate decarboxylase